MKFDNINLNLPIPKGPPPPPPRVLSMDEYFQFVMEFISALTPEQRKKIREKNRPVDVRFQL